VSTARLWLRCLVPLLVCLLVGYLAFEALFSAANKLGAWDERVGLPVLATAQLCSLAALVAMFLVVGRRLPALRRRTASEGADLAERELRLLDVVVLTLAPFLAFYALWGLLEPLIEDHVWRAYENSEPGEGFQVGFARWERFIPIAVGAWLVKSVLVRFKRRSVVITVLVTLLEAVWLFLAFFVLTEGAQASAGWLGDRAVSQWISDAWSSAMGWLGQFGLPFSLTVPEILTALWDFWREIVWPGLKDAVGQPLVWLAITALIFRRPVERDTFTGSGMERGVARAVGGLRWDRRFLVDMLTRDYRDKYLPMVAAIRMVLRLGLPFLAALCLLYVSVDALADWLFVWAVGVLDDAMAYPSYLSGTLDLGHQVLVETWQVCLLAVAYDRVVSARAYERESRESTVSPAG
jgi:hypothetical protein